MLNVFNKTISLLLVVVLLTAITLSLPGCDSSETNSIPTAGNTMEPSPTPSASASPIVSPTATPTPTIIPPTASPTPIKKVFVIEDEGEVCIQPHGEFAITAIIYPKGCFSSSCTVVLEKSGDMKVDQGNRTIRFHSRFVGTYDMGDKSTIRVCSGDCGGLRSVTCELTYLSQGTYTIFLGDKELGQLMVPIRIPEQGKCFGERF